jgi:hypothetical protein
MILWIMCMDEPTALGMGRGVVDATQILCANYIYISQNLLIGMPRP